MGAWAVVTCGSHLELERFPFRGGRASEHFGLHHSADAVKRSAHSAQNSGKLCHAGKLRRHSAEASEVSECGHRHKSSM
eukprot:1804629-Amphidinium_carterae.1